MNETLFKINGGFDISKKMDMLSNKEHYHHDDYVSDIALIVYLHSLGVPMQKSKGNVLPLVSIRERKI